MRLKFTYRRVNGNSTDLVAELEGQATVGQLATHLAYADPETPRAQDGAAVTLAIADGRKGVLNPLALVAESELGSGATVMLAPAPSQAGSPRSQSEAAARVRVLSGPDHGREFLLGHGAAVIGREHGCEIQLTDPRASRRHARLNILENLEVIDLGSANGIMVGLAPTQRATIGSGDILTVGDTQLEITQLRRSEVRSGVIEFIRPARVVPEYEGREFEAPTPPERTKPNRMPTAALIAPLIMGGILYSMTHNAQSIVFVALSPLMLVGTFLEGLITGKREFKRAVAAFREDIAGLSQAVSTELQTEIVARLVEHPSSAECLAAAAERSELLWCRRPDLGRFAEVRLGLGRDVARSTIELASPGRAPYHLVQEVEETVAPLKHVDGVPIVAALDQGALGVAGPRVAMLGTARAVIAQIAGLHSPAELVIAALVTTESGSDWDWLKWLPHTSSPQSPLEGRTLVATADDASVLVSRLEALVEDRRTDGGSEPRVLVVVESGAPVQHSRLVALAEQGAGVGIHLVWLATDRSLLPASCKTYVEVGGHVTDGRVGYVTRGEEIVPVLVESVDATSALTMARALSSVDDIGAGADDDSDLPRSISQLVTLGDPALAARAESVIERWQTSHSIVTGPYAPAEPVRKAGSLRAVVGMASTGPHTLDLRTDGPHALVGGTTNSGKSELLQSWILSMAATHSPERVTFLLVDYKGGSAFSDCVDLPHTVGLVTDLSQHMVRRALVSLSAELKYREHLLHRYNAKDLIEMEKHGIAGAPPSLVIVVDEFASLVNEVPEFVDGVVNVAARGRSLGLHLILATQQPSGVIKGSLRANTNLRLALRVADEQDSMDVLNAPDAAGFDPLIPGRAMSRSGPKRLVAFQTSYAGGWTSETPDPPRLLVEELSMVNPVEWAMPEVEQAPKDREATDIKRMVRTIVHANAMAGLPEPRKPWLPVLPSAVDVAALPRARRDDELVFALGDDPESQQQPPVAFRPDREGNLAVYGASGAGKSTLLRAFAVSAAFTQRGGPIHVYGLDFGSRALQMLETLPHVGSIIPGADHERLTRLLRWLRGVIDERAARYSEINASTITEYRTKAGRPQEPRIVLLVDNIGAFRSAYEVGDRFKWVELLTSIASDGRPVGVHLIVTAAERNAIHTTLSSAIQRRLVMRMAVEDDYAMLGVPTDVLDTKSAPGRAIDGEAEIQIGILGSDRDDASQAARLKGLADALRSAGVPEAPPIQSLGDRIPLDSIADAEEELTLGVSAASLAPIGVDASGAFLLTGGPGSGRSTALVTLVTSAIRRLPGVEVHLFGPSRSAVAAVPGVASVSSTPEAIAAKAAELTERLTARSAGDPRVIVIVEGAGDLAMGPADMPLQNLVRACIAAEQWFVIEGEGSTIRTSSGFIGAVKAARRGLAMQPDQDTGTMLFNTPFPRINRAEFPEGRGLLVSGGRLEIVQVALPRDDG